MNAKLTHLIVLIVFISKLEPARSSYCRQGQLGPQIVVTCENFTRFDQLNFASEFKNGQQISVLNLVPSTRLILDNSLNLSGLNFTNYFNISFYGLKGIDVTVDLYRNFDISELDKKSTLSFNDSSIEFFYQNKSVDLLDCDRFIKSETPVFSPELVFPITQKLVFTNSRFIKPICPIMFALADLQAIYIYDSVFVNNTPLFYDSKLFNFTFADISCLIRSCEYSNVFDSYLSSSLLDPTIFHFLSSLVLQIDPVTKIQFDLFGSLPTLKRLELRLLDLADWIAESNTNSIWMTFLNSNVSVDLEKFKLTNETSQLPFVFNLTDLAAQYTFPDLDFCKFKEFPHQKLLVPAIKTRNSLKCTCTLLYLLQYKSIYDYFTPNPLETDSTQKCLTDPNFNFMIQTCNFKNRLETCYNRTITSTTSAPSSGTTSDRPSSATSLDFRPVWR
jgi:hypothetical protein